MENACGDYQDIPEQMEPMDGRLYSDCQFLSPLDIQILRMRKLGIRYNWVQVQGGYRSKATQLRKEYQEDRKPENVSWCKLTFLSSNTASVANDSHVCATSDLPW